MIEKEGGHDIAKKHEATFERWFRDNIYSGERNAKNVPKQLYHLSLEPDRQVKSYRGRTVNGVRFYTKECAETHTTQSSGIVVKGGYNTSDNKYYGELKNIFELYYPGRNWVYLFKCDWWDTESNTQGIRKEKGFTIVNTSHKWYASNPFILACQVAQVFYLSHP
jgi:hypothetical protein